MPEWSLSISNRGREEIFQNSTAFNSFNSAGAALEASGECPPPSVLEAASWFLTAAALEQTRIGSQLEKLERSCNERRTLY